MTISVSQSTASSTFVSNSGTSNPADSSLTSLLDLQASTAKPNVGYESKTLEPSTESASVGISQAALTKLKELIEIPSNDPAVLEAEAARKLKMAPEHLFLAAHRYLEIGDLYAKLSEFEKAFNCYLVSKELFLRSDVYEGSVVGKIACLYLAGRVGSETQTQRNAIAESLLRDAANHKFGNCCPAVMNNYAIMHIKGIAGLELGDRQDLRDKVAVSWLRVSAREGSSLAVETLLRLHKMKRGEWSEEIVSRLETHLLACKEREEFRILLKYVAKDPKKVYRYQLDTALFDETDSSFQISLRR